MKIVLLLLYFTNLKLYFRCFSGGITEMAVDSLPFQPVTSVSLLLAYVICTG